MRTRTSLRLLTGLCLTGVGLTGCDSGGPGDFDHGVGNKANLDAYAGPQFLGAGNSGAGSSLAAGNVTIACDGHLPLPAGTFGPTGNVVSHETCFYSADDPTTPAATTEWIVESAPEGDLVHIRLTLNPSFVDNTYGANAIGWTNTQGPGGAMGGPMGGPMGMMGPMGMSGHTFKDLVESDHAEFKLSDTRGTLLMSFDADYISQDAAAPSGWGTLGVTGGEGKMLTGNAADVVAVSTSLDRDLNACGLGTYTTDSPATDAYYTVNPAAQNWDYRVVYDVWVRKSAFAAAGFGAASVDFVHASPSKQGKATIDVVPGTCPPAWPPYCADTEGCCGADLVCNNGKVPPSNTGNTCTGEGCIGI